MGEHILVNSEWLEYRGFKEVLHYEDTWIERHYESPAGFDGHSIRLHVNARDVGHVTVYRVMRWGWFMVDRHQILKSTYMKCDDVLDLCRIFGIKLKHAD